MQIMDLSQPIDRRQFLRASSALTAGLSIASINLSRAFGQQPNGAAKPRLLANGVPNAEKLGWRVGVQTYTFHRFSLFEAINMTASLGLKYIETCPGHRISKDEPHGLYSGTPAEIRTLLKNKLAEAGMKHTSHYEPLAPAVAHRVFSFCQDMGLEMLITDPPRVPTGEGSIEWYEKVANEYGIKLVLTNHPKQDGAAYWDPDQIVEDCKGRSKSVGASCDPGHFMRGGFAPKDAVAKYMKIDRMYHFHFRDVDKIGPGGVDVPLGEGVADIEGIAKELHRNNLKPLFQIEYERDFTNPMAQLVPSVNYFNDLCGKLLMRESDTPTTGE